VQEVYPDHVIVRAGEDYYSVPYTEPTDDEFEFDLTGATEVERSWTAVTAKTFHVVEKDDERQLAFGWAYVSEKADGTPIVDHSGEFIRKEDLEDSAYLFNLAFREGDERHTETVRAHLVESFVATPEKLAKMGLAEDALPRGWWTGWYIPEPEVYQRFKSETAMLSIGGLSKREEGARVA